MSYFAFLYELFPYELFRGTQVNTDSVSNLHLFSDDKIQLMVMEAEAEAESDDELQINQNNNDVYLNDQTEFENILEELGNQFVTRTKFINGVRCAEHTLQLTTRHQ